MPPPFFVYHAFQEILKSPYFMRALRYPIILISRNLKNGYESKQSPCVFVITQFLVPVFVHSLRC